MKKEPIVSNGVYVTLTEFFYNCNKKDVNYSIAKALILKIREFPNIYIEEISFLANTTPASVTKFCQKIGYGGFTEMKNDLRNDLDYEMFDQMREVSRVSGFNESYLHFLQMEKRRVEEWYQSLDIGQIIRIGRQLKFCSKIAVVVNNYSFGIANLFRELLSQHGVTVFEVNRRADDEVLKSIFRVVDCVFVISLSGEWVQKRLNLLKASKDKNTNFVLINGSSISAVPPFDEVISVGNEKEISCMSNYLTYKRLQHICILLANAVTG